MIDKNLITACIAVGLICICIGYVVGFGMGVKFALEIAVNKGVEFLQLQGYSLNIDIEKISNLLAIYNAKSGEGVVLIYNNTETKHLNT